MWCFMKNVRRTLPDALQFPIREVDDLLWNRCGNAPWNHLKFITFTPKMKNDGRKLYKKSSSTCIENQTKIHDFGAKGVPKSIQNVSRSAPKAILEANRFWDLQKVPTPAARHVHLGTIWVILGAVLATAGRQGIPKIKRFGTRDTPKS